MEAFFSPTVSHILKVMRFEKNLNLMIFGTLNQLFCKNWNHLKRKFSQTFMTKYRKIKQITIAHGIFFFQCNIYPVMSAKVAVFFMHTKRLLKFYTHLTL